LFTNKLVYKCGHRRFIPVDHLREPFHRDPGLEEEGNQDIPMTRDDSHEVMVPQFADEKPVGLLPNPGDQIDGPVLVYLFHVFVHDPIIV